MERGIHKGAGIIKQSREGTVSQPIEVGAMFGGRYEVTEMVMASADGDNILVCFDKVLNRQVSVLLGSPANSPQLTANAREIATGERYGAVQVLDLGATEDRSYVVTNIADPADLFDILVQQDAPYIEPFYTDTLGTEIFGVSRSTDPVTYSDDAEYYEGQRAQEEGRPAVLGKLPEINLNEKISGLKGRFGRSKSDPAAAPVLPPMTVGSSTEQAPAVAAPTQPPAPGAPTAAAPKAAPVRAPQPAPAPAPAPKVTRMDTAAEPAVTSAAALAAAQKSRGVTVDESGQRVAASFPSAAQSYTEPVYEDYEDEEAPEGGKKTTRLLVGAVVCAVLIGGVVFAYNALGGNPPSPAATSSIVQTTESSQEGGSESPSAETIVKPKIDGITRLVPGNQDLNAATDNTLPKAIDGNPASLYKSYSYTSPQFGGFASNMVFTLELKELSDISEIQLEGLNGTGGSFEVRVGKTNDLSEAKVVTTGSFTGPTITVPVSGENGAALQGQYVFLNVTELPRRASGANGSRPYGLQIGEFRVS